MIIAALLDLVVDVFHVVLSALAFVDIPQSVFDVLTSSLVYLQSGVQVVAAYTHFSYLVSLLDFVILFDMFYTGYIVWKWIMQKIPMWGLH